MHFQICCEIWRVQCLACFRATRPQVFNFLCWKLFRQFCLTCPYCCSVKTNTKRQWNSESVNSIWNRCASGRGRGTRSLRAAARCVLCSFLVFKSTSGLTKHEAHLSTSALGRLFVHYVYIAKWKAAHRQNRARFDILSGLWGFPRDLTYLTKAGRF